MKRDGEDKDRQLSTMNAIVEEMKKEIEREKEAQKQLSQSEESLQKVLLSAQDELKGKENEPETVLAQLKET